MELNEEHGYFPLRIEKIRNVDLYAGTTKHGETFLGTKADLQAAKIHVSATANGPVFLSGNVVIGSEAFIGRSCQLQNCSIGEDTRIGEFTWIYNSKIKTRCNIGMHASIYNSFIPKGAYIADRCKLDRFTPESWLSWPESKEHTAYPVNLDEGASLTEVNRFITGVVGKADSEYVGFTFFIGGGYLRIGCTGKAIRDWLAHPLELESTTNILFALANWDDLVQHFIDAKRLRFGKRDAFIEMANKRKSDLFATLATHEAALARMWRYKVNLTPIFGDS